MGDNSTNPFYEPEDRNYRRSSNNRSFWDDDPSPDLKPSSNNPFYDHTSASNNQVYKRGGYGGQNGHGNYANTSNNSRRELMGNDSEFVTKPSAIFDEDENDFDPDAPFDAEAYRQKMLLKKIRESSNRQVDMQHRAIANIYESEQMGISTAEELIHQGEQLDNAERKTGVINQTMKTSEKHVNKLSSMFGGFRGWFGKKEAEDEPVVAPRDPDRLRNTVDSYKDSTAAYDKEGSNHPAVRMRDQDRQQSSNPYAPGNEPITSSRQAFQQYDQQFNSNLDVMSDGLSRLRGLGLVLQTEIETQNDQIERINTQVERADTKVVQQTKRMNVLLKK